MKLHEAESPNARRVSIVLKEKGIDIPRVAVDIRGGENLTPEFLAVSYTHLTLPTNSLV